MSKKGLISSLIIGLVVTLSLGIYTLVSVFGGANAPKGPVNTDIVLAYRTGDVVDVFKDYDKDSIEFTYPETNTENPLELDNETGNYIAVHEGEVNAVVALNKKGDTNTYKIKVWTHYTENNDADHPYIVANKDHLIELANNFNSDPEAKAPAYVKIGGDIDLSGINWQPIGSIDHPYDGYINGNGFKISNLKISINLDNYADYLAVASDGTSAGVSTPTRAYMDLGLFGVYKNNTIERLNVENAVISIHDDVYYALRNEDFSETNYKMIASVTAGAIAGRAENATVIGGEEEGKSNVSVRLSAFSYTQDGYANGIGGLFGVGNLVRISNYAVNTTVINNTKEIEKSNIGGVVGYLTTSSVYGGEAVTEQMKNKIDNVAVNFDASVVYNNSALVGGVVGYAFNADIINSTIESFKVYDPAIRGNIDFNFANPTMVGGVAGRILSTKVADTAASNAFVSSIKDVIVSGIDVNILGGRAAGVVANLGAVYGSSTQSLYESMKVTNVIISGSNKITAHQAGGFAFQVNPGVTIEYTEDIADTNVINIELSGHNIAGIAVFNMGTIKGFSKTVTPEVAEDEEPLPSYVVKPVVNVTLKGMGAEIDDSSAESFYLLRTNTYAAGLVAYNQNNSYASVIPELTDFEVNANISNGVNYSGVSYFVSGSKIANISVKANFTSYTGLDANKQTFSTTYSVAGIANIAEAGSEILNCSVEMNLNNGVDTSKAYAASLVAGLVARYTGDNNGKGLTLTSNTVSGNVYVNYMYHEVAFSSTEQAVESENPDVYVPIFVAGGLVAMMSGITQEGVDSKFDAFAPISIQTTKDKITSNTVENLTITAEFAKENEELKAVPNKYLHNLAYRVRAIGATIGVLYTDRNQNDQLDLSNGNKVSKVLIRAYERTFTYEYSTPIQGHNSNVTLGGNKQHTYGISYKLNTGTEDVKDITEFDATNEELIKYEELDLAV